MSRGEKRFNDVLATRFPTVVAEAVKKLVKEKQKEFPRYSEADLIRSAVVNHLKSKGFLDKGKNYL